MSKVSEEENDLLVEVPQQWDNLLMKAKNVDAKLITVKLVFTQVGTCFFFVVMYELLTKY